MTGGTGYLGRVVVELAAVAGWDVTAAGSRDVDVRDAVAVDAFVAALRPDAIVHTAYVRDGPDAGPVNVAGSEAVAQAAVAVGARLVHVSTDVVFDGLAGRPYREDDPVSPVNDYGRSKAAAEVRVLAVDPGAVVVRTSLIYSGPSRPPGPQEQLAVDPAVTFFSDELRCPVQVDDLAAALVELTQVDVRGVLHVAGAEGVSRQRFAELVAGHPVRGAPAPPGRPLDCRLDSSRAAALLPTRPRGISEVLGPS
ncbi:MAG: sugar nucleotide-binding protein [Ilumatobacteraceae bacterium]